MNETVSAMVAQLGGMGLLRLMLGTRQLLFNEKSIRFDIRGCPRVNRVQIDYEDGLDTYRIQFFKYRPKNTVLTLIADYKDIYCDQLVSLIESETGLYLRPVRIQRAYPASV